MGAPLTLKSEESKSLLVEEKPHAEVGKLRTEDSWVSQG
jgi:hypothetical protein